MCSLSNVLADLQYMDSIPYIYMYAYMPSFCTKGKCSSIQNAKRTPKPSERVIGHLLFFFSGQLIYPKTSICQANSALVSRLLRAVRDGNLQRVIAAIANKADPILAY